MLVVTDRHAATCPCPGPAWEAGWLGGPGCPSLLCRTLPRTTAIDPQSELRPESCSAPQPRMWQEVLG